MLRNSPPLFHDKTFYFCFSNLEKLILFPKQPNAKSPRPLNNQRPIFIVRYSIQLFVSFMCIFNIYIG